MVTKATMSYPTPPRSLRPTVDSKHTNTQNPESLTFTTHILVNKSVFRQNKTKVRDLNRKLRLQN